MDSLFESNILNILTEKDREYVSTCDRAQGAVHLRNVHMRVNISSFVQNLSYLHLNLFDFSRHRCPHEEPEHLTIQGDFYTPEKQPYRPVEKTKPFKPQDNLTITTGEFYSQTTSQKDFTREIEEDTQIRRNTYTKEESDLIDTTSIRKRTWTKEELEAVRQKVRDDEKPKYKPVERPTQVKPTDNLKPEGDFVRDKKPGFVPAERPQQVKPSDNLKPEGQMYTPTKDQFVPADRPQQVRPTDNLRPEGDFVRDRKPDFVPAERPQQVKITLKNL